ncbi:hypothetical protein [Parabacteroides goldsteinii]|uniref:hypothetical protein n=1 Tax=Parabacteroides goldsteinii TaxID=328812 RepID=UPI00242F232B|nr:hypothetical protein [Parabacteroides goldsteinii]
MDSLQRWKTQYRFYRTFFLSTLKFSVLISFLFASMGAITSIILYNGNIMDSVKLWFRLIPTVGLGFDYIYKELTRKEEYFFYYNQGIGKYQLWIVTFIVMFICCNLLNQIIELCTQALK